MRLWHRDLLKHLPKQWLMGQHRECCALRGKGWGRLHETVNYVFDYNFIDLVHYHREVIQILTITHGVNVDLIWWNEDYRGKQLGTVRKVPNCYIREVILYPEHDDKYYIECCENLIEKFKIKGLTAEILVFNELLEYKKRRIKGDSGD